MFIVRARRRLPLSLLVLCALAGAVFCAEGFAQNPFGIPGLDGQAPGVARPPNVDPVAISAQFTASAGETTGELLITATIAPGWHTFSITQPPGGPVGTTIAVEASSSYTVGKFEPVSAPENRFDNRAFPGVELEEHEDVVTWRAPLTFSAGVSLGQLEVAGTVHYQTCDATSCLPPKTVEFTASLGPGLEMAPAEPATGEWTSEISGAMVTGRLEAAGEGGEVNLVLSIDPPAGTHVYAVADRDTGDPGGKPTLVVFSRTGGFQPGAPVPSHEPELSAGLANPFHAGLVTWTVPLAPPAGESQVRRTVAGILAFQVCTETSCSAPEGAAFSATWDPAQPPETPVLLALATSDYISAADLSNSKDQEIGAIQVAEVEGGWTRIAAMVGFGLLGGFILNFMPCVLPVIGLKVLAFVEQSHHDRRRVFMLNLWYSVGLMSVFWFLGALFAAFNVIWGELFTYLWVNLALAALVFVMALSFLGVWQIPIPGFAGGSKATSLASQEGVLGAFLKGVFTTILATPCSGPFLGGVIGFIAKQPPGVILLVFSSMGLGMALPYLLIGAAPALVRFLPKPGDWMETFERIMGFVLLLAVAWLLVPVGSEYFARSFAFLVALWAGFWWIGRTPAYAELSEKLKAWGAAAVVAGIAGYLLFGLFGPKEALLPWEPFTQVALDEHRRAGRTVLVDFTADW